MNISPSEMDELRQLLVKIQGGDEPLSPQEEHRFRQLLARENERALGMGWDELVKFARIVHGLWIVREASRERGLVGEP